MRLTKQIRLDLIQYASDLVKNEPREQKTSEALDARQAKLRATAWALITKAIPAKERAILEKYGRVIDPSSLPDYTRRYYLTLYLSRTNQWLTPNPDDQYKFVINETDLSALEAHKSISLPSNWLPVPKESPFWHEVDAVNLKVREYSSHLITRVQPYVHLITSCNTMKQILKAWPEAIDANLGGSRTLAVLSTSDSEAIGNDMFSRAPNAQS